MTARRWMITIFDISWDHHKIDTKKIKYVRGQAEVCPETAKRHYQLYVVVQNSCRFTALKTWMDSPTCHIERAMGTHTECVEYVTKEETRDLKNPWTIVIGDDKMIGQGVRTDYETAAATINSKGLKRLLEEEPGFCLKNINKIVKYNEVMSLYGIKSGYKERLVIWVEGVPGIGKTRAAHDAWPDHVHFLRKTSTQTWWDGYDPKVHDVLVLDDMTAGLFTQNEMLSFTDVYNDCIQVKGSMIRMNYAVLIITSSYSFDCCFPWDTQGALKRRMNIMLSGVQNRFWLATTFRTVYSVIPKYFDSLSEKYRGDWQEALNDQIPVTNFVTTKMDIQGMDSCEDFSPI